jgi:hypothetical protein
MTADLLRALAHCVTPLAELAERDWDVAVPGMAWTVRETVEHLVDTLGFYTLHLAAQTPERLRIDVRCHDGVANDVALDVLTAEARGLANLSELLPPTARAWHFHGTADVSGFVAMACAELLVHGHDACRGLGRSLDPEPEVASRVVRRLFPSAPPDTDPGQTLLWATGRASLDGHDDVGADWTYHPQPADLRG